MKDQIHVQHVQYYFPYKSWGLLVNQSWSSRCCSETNLVFHIDFNIKSVEWRRNLPQVIALRSPFGVNLISNWNLRGKMKTTVLHIRCWCLKHWCGDNMAANFRTINKKKCIFLIENAWISLQINWRFELTMFQNWFRKWLGAVQRSSHCLNQWWLIYRRIYSSFGLNDLTYWNQDKWLATILQTVFSKAQLTIR